MADEHRADAMGAAGHPFVRTPALDALAARGTRFTKAYTPSPICVPARAALATGLPVHRTGHWDSAAPWRGTPESWMHRLARLGVETTSFGKLHFGGDPADHGFARQVLPMHVHGEGWTVGLLRDDPPPFDKAADLAADLGAGESEYTRYDRAVADAAAAWLGEPARRAEPWAAFISFVTPHYPLRAPEPFMAALAHIDPGLPAAWRETPDHPEIRRLAEFWAYDRHFDEARAREARRAYFALCGFTDSLIGQVLQALAASGAADDTLVLYLSDHGEMLGDFGFWTKSVMYEASARVPMIAAGPGIPVGGISATPVSLLDVATTALAQYDAPSDDLPGGDLAAIARALDDGDRAVFSEYHDGGASTGAFMLRWDRWKYIHYPGLAPQLFDLVADPGERRDLGTDNATDACAARAEGERRLRALCDPEAVDRAVKADQRARVAALGGREACIAGAFGHTPAPGVD